MEILHSIKILGIGLFLATLSIATFANDINIKIINELNGDLRIHGFHAKTNCSGTGNLGGGWLDIYQGYDFSGVLNACSGNHKSEWVSLLGQLRSPNRVNVILMKHAGKDMEAIYNQNDGMRVWLQKIDENNYILHVVN